MVWLRIAIGSPSALGDNLTFTGRNGAKAPQAVPLARVLPGELGRAHREWQPGSPRRSYWPSANRPSTATQRPKRPDGRPATREPVTVPFQGARSRFTLLTLGG